MSEEDNIGKKIKERLKGHEFPVSGKVWEHIHKNMPPELLDNAAPSAGKVAGSSSSATIITSIIVTGLAALVALSVYVYSFKQTNTHASETTKTPQSIRVPANPSQMQAESDLPAHTSVGGANANSRTQDYSTFEKTETPLRQPAVITERKAKPNNKE